MLLGRFKISGHSMMPTLIPGESILISTIPYLFSNPKKGEIIVFKYKNKNLVKRIKKISEDDYILEGDNKSDSLKIQNIKQKDIVGKFLFKI